MDMYVTTVRRVCSFTDKKRLFGSAERGAKGREGGVRFLPIYTNLKHLRMRAGRDGLVATKLGV
jgi:hypothetical protein